MICHFSDWTNEIASNNVIIVDCFRALKSIRILEAHTHTKTDEEKRRRGKRDGEPTAQRMCKYVLTEM